MAALENGGSTGAPRVTPPPLAGLEAHGVLMRIFRSIEVSIPAGPAGDPGSIPGGREFVAGVCVCVGGGGLRAADVPKRLRGWTRNPLGSARAGSSPAVCDIMCCVCNAASALLGERQTEDLKVPGSIPGGGILSSQQSYPSG